ncbi:MAG: response regulator [Idiomarina sp.]|nr:response regulator [Idiomarina sp.]
MSVLVVEDELDIQGLLRDYLCHEGYQVSVCGDGQQALSMLRESAFDLVLLDVMLPGMDGLALCQALREFSQVPVIFLTARHEEIDRLLGLRLGADDYICKPFSPREVVARVEAILRRQRWQQAPGQAVAKAGLSIDETRFDARLDGIALDLTPVEYRLLKALVAQPGRVFRRDQLVSAAYDDYRVVSDRTIDSHIKNVRIKLANVRETAVFIHAVYGVGYRFEPE